MVSTSGVVTWELDPSMRKPMEDITRGAGRYGPEDTLASATIANRGLEANARVSEAVFATEMMDGDPQGPDCQFKSYAIMARFHQKNPEMGEAALLARQIFGRD